MSSKLVSTRLSVSRTCCATPALPYFGEDLDGESGLNIEGLAVRGDQLIIGLRGPSAGPSSCGRLSARCSRKVTGPARRPLRQFRSPCRRAQASGISRCFRTDRSAGSSSHLKMPPLALRKPGQKDPATRTDVGEVSPHIPEALPTRSHKEAGLVGSASRFVRGLAGRRTWEAVRAARTAVRPV